jgi:hypothetical protein
MVFSPSARNQVAHLRGNCRRAGQRCGEEKIREMVPRTEYTDPGCTPERRGQGNGNLVIAQPDRSCVVNTVFPFGLPCLGFCTPDGN